MQSLYHVVIAAFPEETHYDFQVVGARVAGLRAGQCPISRHQAVRFE